MLIDFFTIVDSLDPSFRGYISGASAEDLATYQSLVNGPIPPPYWTYLQHMGQDDGGLRIAEDAATDIKTVTAYYKHMRENGLPTPEKTLLIARGGLGVEAMGISVNPSTTGQVRILDVPGQGRLYADSFEKLLCRRVFIKLVLEKIAFPHSACWRSQTDVSQKEMFDEKLSIPDLQRLPFSDSVQSFYTANDLVVQVSHIEGDHTQLFVHAQTSELISWAATVLGQKLLSLR